MEKLVSMISGNEIDSKSFEGHWQEFILQRQEIIELSDPPNGYVQAKKELCTLLDSISERMDKKLVRDLDEVVTNLEIAATYLHYNKGYLDGIKFALMVGKL